MLKKIKNNEGDGSWLTGEFSFTFLRWWALNPKPLIKQKGEEHLSQKENHIFILCCLKKGVDLSSLFHKTRRSSSQPKVKENGGVLCTITIRSFGFAFPKPMATKSSETMGPHQTFSSGASLSNYGEQQKYGGNTRKLGVFVLMFELWTLNF